MWAADTKKASTRIGGASEDDLQGGQKLTQGETGKQHFLSVPNNVKIGYGVN